MGAGHSSSRVGLRSLCVLWLKAGPYESAQHRGRHRCSQASVGRGGVTARFGTDASAVGRSHPSYVPQPHFAQPDRGLVGTGADQAVFALAHDRIRTSKEDLADALCGRLTSSQQLVLTLYLEQIEHIERHMAEGEKALPRSLSSPRPDRELRPSPPPASWPPGSAPPRRFQTPRLHSHHRPSARSSYLTGLFSSVCPRSIRAPPGLAEP